MDLNMDPSLFTIAAILAFVLPPIIAVINRCRWRAEVKGVMAFAVSVVASLGTLWYEDKLNTTDIRNTVILVFGGAIFFYTHFWKPTQIAPKIERATG